MVKFKESKLYKNNCFVTDDDVKDFYTDTVDMFLSDLCDLFQDESLLKSN